MINVKKLLIPIVLRATEMLASVSWDEKQKRDGLDEIASRMSAQ